MNKILSFFLTVALINPMAFAGEDGKLGAATRNLTDEEQHEANTYSHTGRTNRVLEDKCANYQGYNDLCNNSEYGFSGGMQTLEMMMPIASQAWAMFSNINPKISYDAKDNAGHQIYKDQNGKDIKATGKNPDTGEGLYQTSDGKTISEKELASKDDVSKKEEKKTDYCGYVPMVGEMATAAFGTIMAANTEQQFNQTDPNHRQTAALRATKKAQKDRATTATVQSGVWGATGACYAATLIAGANPNFNVISKLSAAVILTTFFVAKTVAHNNRADAIQELIDSLPKAGECNPHTDTVCFCDEPSSYQFDSKNYTKYCLPHQFVARAGQTPMVCMTKDGKTDPECKCKAAGACADSNLKLASLELGLNPSLMKDAFASIKPVTDGTVGADLAPAVQRNLAMMKKTLSSVNPKNVPKVKLNAEQTKIAKAIADMGIPASIAAAMAAAPAKGNLPSSLQGGYVAGSDSFKKILRDADSSLKFNRTANNKSLFKKKSSTSAFGKKPGAKKGGIEIVDYGSSELADRATQKAQINMDKGKNIFEIVTYRYKMSAWSRFEDQMKNALNPAGEAASKQPASEDQQPVPENP